MTHRHIKFQDSAVMRELERQEIKKSGNSIKLEQMVKQASSKPLATGDLLNDLFTLANSLRARGYVKQAEQLENKLFLCKQAETHLYRALDEDGEDVIERAHPDGDVEMGKAQDQNGMVETIVSRHKKMVDVVNKKPTGKQAETIVGLIASAAYVLGVDLKKVGQQANEDTSVEEAFSDKAKEKKNTTEALNQIITKSFAEIEQELQDALSDCYPNTWMFDSDITKASSAVQTYYESLEQLEAGAINKWVTKYTNALGQNTKVEGDATTIIFGKIKSFGDADHYQELVGYVKSVAPELVGMCVGTPASQKKQNFLNDHTEKANDPLMANNDSSVWDFDVSDHILSLSASFTLNTKRAFNLAAKILESLNAEYNTILNPKKLADASNKFHSRMTEFFTPAFQVRDFFATPPEISKESPASAVIGALLEQRQKLSVYSGKQSTPFLSYVQLIWPGWTPKIVENASTISKSIGELIQTLNNKVTEIGEDVVLTKEIAEPIIDNFHKAGKMWYDAAQKLTTSSPDYKKYYSYAKQSLVMADAVANNINKPFSEVYQAIKGITAKSNTLAALTITSNNWLQKTINDLGTAWEEPHSNNTTTSGAVHSLTKQADGIDDSAPSGSAKPASPTPSSATSNTASKAKTSSEEVQNVKLMQDALNSLAISLEALNKYDRAELMKMRNSGQGPNTVSGDGIWGPRTKAALETANKLLGLSLTTTRNVSSAAQDAKNNYDLVQQVLRGMKGGSTGDATVLDGLPTQIDWDSMPETATFAGSSIKLTSADLSSLYSLYNFLTKNSLEQPSVSGASEEDIGQEGIELGKLSRILQWFRKRAVFKYNSIKDQEGLQDAKNAAKLYYQKVVELYSKYTSLLKALNNTFNGLTAEQINSYVVPSQFLSGMANVGGEKVHQKSPHGHEPSNGYYSDEPGGNAYRQVGDHGQGFGGAEEGYSVKHRSNQPPIGENIDLQSGWFDDLAATWLEKLDRPILSLDTFQRTNGVKLAQALFGMAPPSQTSQIQALNMNGFSAGVDAQGRVIFGLPGQQPYFPLEQALKDPNWAAANPRLMASFETSGDRSPVNQMNSFLVALSQAIHGAMNHWSTAVRSRAPEDVIVEVGDLANEWQQTIRRKIQDIQTWRAS